MNTRSNTGTTFTGSVTINSSSSTAAFGVCQYSSPEEIDRWYTDEGLTIVYKREKTSTMYPSWCQAPKEIEVYKEVHTFGPEGHKTEIVQGVYIPPQSESYEFPEEA